MIRHQIRLFLTLFVMATTACSSSSTGPHLSASINLIAGNGQADTVNASLGQPLVIRLGSVPKGQSLAGQTLQYQALAVDTTDMNLGYQAYVTLSSAPQALNSTLSTKTDPAGEDTRLRDTRPAERHRAHRC